MSGTWDRTRAMLDVTSVLGAGAVMATACRAHEEISRPFDIQLNLISERSNIKANDLLHQPMTVVLRHDGNPVRYFHGIARSFSADGRIEGRDLAAYQVRLVPRIWFLGQTADCRIFQKRTVTEIISAIMSEARLPTPKFRLRQPHEAREYITQFNETDLDFISRLLQEEGAYYYFEHTEQGHEMVVADHNSTFRTIPSSPLRFDSAGYDDSVLTGWQHPHGTTHGSMRLIDYDPTVPTNRLEGVQRTVLDAGGSGTRDVFRWPALSYEPKRIKAVTRFRLEADEAGVSLVLGKGRCRDMVPGTAFVLDLDPIDGSVSKTFLIQSVVHEAWDHTIIDDDRTGDPFLADPGINDSGGNDVGTAAAAGSVGYRNSFSVFPLDVPWREPFSVPRPYMAGVHAAIVIGPNGVEIHTDDYARVKVRFFWDHRRDAHPDQAVWARVIYPWAGKGWGWQSTPRVGTEVAVAFMDGDPDRPVVLGGMYNGTDSPIYPDAEKTKSGIRTRSSQQKGQNHFNELTFDDKAGNELIYVQAEKDMRTLVKNDQFLTVGHNRTTTIDNDRTETITRGNETLAIKKGNRSVAIDQGNDALSVSLGNITIDAGAGKIDISAAQSITLTVGDSSIKIDPLGVTIKGLLLKYEANLMLQTKAPMTQFEAAGMMTLKAGIMMLN